MNNAVFAFLKLFQIQDVSIVSNKGNFDKVYTLHSTFDINNAALRLKLHFKLKFTCRTSPATEMSLLVIVFKDGY